MSFTYSGQKKIGDAGEDFFQKCHGNEVEKSEGDLTCDFIYTGPMLLKGAKIELKTDTHLEAKTENFLIEHISDIARDTLGGVRRAVKDGVTYFVIQFINNKKCWWFISEKLLQYILANYWRLKKVYMKNEENGRIWWTQGLLVPRNEVAHLAFHVEWA